MPDEKRLPGRGLVMKADVADAADVAALFDKAEEAFGGVDVLVTAAGIFNPTTFAEAGREHRFERGEPFTTVGPNGRGVYTHRITGEGWLELGRAGDVPCLIRPADGTGFQSGATIRCAGHPAKHIRVEDDRSRGVVTVMTGNVTETFRYDTDTGALISPATVAPPGPSVYQDDPTGPPSSG